MKVRTTDTADTADTALAAVIRAETSDFHGHTGDFRSVLSARS
jgi:hypothetical protein